MKVCVFHELKLRLTFNETPDKLGSSVVGSSRYGTLQLV